MLLLIHIFIDVALIIICTVLLIKSFRRKNNVIARIMGLGFATNLVAIIFSLFTMVVEDISLKFFFNEARFVGLVFVMPVCITLVLSFIGKTKSLTKRNITLLLIVPVVVILSNITNPLFHLFRVNLNVDTFYGVSYVYGEHGIFFWLFFLYGYILTVISIFLLLRERAKKPAMYRGQINVMILSIVSSVILNITVLFTKIPDYADFSTLIFIISAFGQYWSIYKFTPVKLMNKAKDLVMNYIDNLVLIFDYKDKLLYSNDSAAKYFKISTANVTFSEFVNKELLLEYDGETSFDGQEIKLAGDEYFNIGDKTIYDDKNWLAGRVIVLNNMTKLKNALQETEQRANYDYLTGLRNRHSFYGELEKINKQRLQYIVAYCNIDGMKMINELFGNATGDKVILSIAKRIQSQCCDKDICARINADEFAIVFVGKDLQTVTDILENEIYTYTYNIDDFSITIQTTYGVSTKISENFEMVIKNSIDDMKRKKLLQEKGTSGTNLKNIKDVLIQRNYYSDKYEENALKLSREFAIAYGITDEYQLTKLNLLLIYHNLGLLGIPEEIVKRSGALSNEEWEIMKLHTVRGQRISASIEALAELSTEILSHHERYDGFGYPNRLKGTEIPILCRIFSIIEFYFENGQNAMRLLRNYSESRFDPILVECFVDLLNTQLQNESILLKD